jgi:3-oxoacyl-[acyl-carrier-protein] synthase-3
MENIGIRSIGVYVPEYVEDSSTIASKSGIPEDVIRYKFGIVKKHRAMDKEQVSDMAVKASMRALGDLDPKDLDLVVYCGSEYKDYYLFNLAAKVQYEIGAINANAFEIHSLCSAGVYSLKVLKSMMLNDKYINKVLLVSSSKETDLIDYKNENSRFMFNFGDGAAAILLEKGLNKNVIKETYMITDGQFAEDVACYGVGSRNFYKNECLDYKNRILDVKDINCMKERLDPITLENFIKAIEGSVKKSGYDKENIGYIAPIFMKKSILLNVLEKFGLKEDNSFVLEEYGHCQSADAYISLVEGERLGRLKSGDVAVLLGAGTGYTWAATTVLWGEVV